MNINVERLKQLRAEQGWSQEQLSEMCNVNLRTIQRVESRGTASLETVRALAAVFGVDKEQFIAADTFTEHKIVRNIVHNLKRFDDFSSSSSRAEFWWFFLFVVLILALAEAIHPILLTIVSIVLLVPFLAASTRRLNDGGHSPWLQFFYLVPFGQIVVLIYLAQPTKPVERQQT